MQEPFPTAAMLVFLVRMMTSMKMNLPGGLVWTNDPRGEMGWYCAVVTPAATPLHGLCLKGNICQRRRRSFELAKVLKKLTHTAEVSQLGKKYTHSRCHNFASLVKQQPWLCWKLKLGSLTWLPAIRFIIFTANVWSHSHSPQRIIIYVEQQN